MSPVDLATKRREADRRELERAKAAEDWAAAFDVILGVQHEAEGHLMRLVVEQTATREEVQKLGRAWADANAKLGALVEKLERPPVPSYRPSLASANNLDAQALGQTIEGVFTELQGNQLAITARVVALETTIGAPPDEIKGAKGTGLAGIVHKLNSKATLAKLALLAAVASALGTNVGEFVRWLLHAAKG